MEFDELEQRCIRFLAERFQNGTDHGVVRSPQEVIDALGLPDVPAYEMLMRTMESRGCIENLSNTNARFARCFTISPTAVQLARAIERSRQEAAAPRDIVADVEERARRHPKAAWVIIAVVALTALIVLANQLLELLQKLGLWKQN
jgi:hypothetical protein